MAQSGDSSTLHQKKNQGQNYHIDKEDGNNMALDDWDQFDRAACSRQYAYYIAAERTIQWNAEAEEACRKLAVSVN
jgi:hypothetical protein